MIPTPKQIRKLRKAQDLTMAQAAELIEVSRSAWAHWEYGRRPMSAPNWKLFRILCERLF